MLLLFVCICVVLLSVVFYSVFVWFVFNRCVCDVVWILALLTVCCMFLVLLLMFWGCCLFCFFLSLLFGLSVVVFLI